MRDTIGRAHAGMRLPRKAVRSRAVEEFAERLRAETAARSTTGIPGMIGFGLLLASALLIVVGSLIA
jgi:hypothetical protein